MHRVQVRKVCRPYHYATPPSPVITERVVIVTCCCLIVDLAVGAPYEGQGAVYLFHGSHEGLHSEPSQRIYAGNLPSPLQPLRTFGHTLSAGVDMDLNGYPDMVVGAFGADKMLMLRSRPVINVMSTMQSRPARIDPQVTLSNRCLDRPDTSCIELELCFQFTTKPRDRSVTRTPRLDQFCFLLRL